MRATVSTWPIPCLLCRELAPEPWPGPLCRMSLWWAVRLRTLVQWRKRDREKQGVGMGISLRAWGFEIFWHKLTFHPFICSTNLYSIPTVSWALLLVLRTWRPSVCPHGAHLLVDIRLIFDICFTFRLHNTLSQILSKASICAIANCGLQTRKMVVPKAKWPP